MNNLNFSHLRMNSFSEMQKYELELGKEVYDKYVNSVLRWLHSQHCGWRYDIAKMEESKREIFIKVTCMLIADGTAGDFSFNETFTQLIRN